MSSLRFVLRAIAGLLLASLALSTASCAALPQSSSIRYSGDILGNLGSDYLYYSPAGPAKGMTQREVLAGFMNAATGPQNDYAIARQYLTTGARSEWAPNQEVLIQRGAAKTQFVVDNVAVMEIDVQASVDAAGNYRQSEGDTKRNLQYNFVMQNGEWRISQAPNLTVLLRPVFDVIFRSYSVYFWNSNHSALIPDLRWFPERASTATRLVSALLEGPVEWLASASTDAPTGTALVIDSVPVVNELAQVNLNQNFLASQAIERRYFYTQLRETLRQVTGVRDVQILVQASPQEIEPFALPTESADSSPIALSSGSLVATDAATQEILNGSKNLLQTLAASDFALSPDLRQIAVKDSSGIWLASLSSVTTSASRVDARDRLLAPQFDTVGLLWSKPEAGEEAFSVISPSGNRVVLGTRWLAGLKVRAFALSPEGARLAVLAGDKGEYRIYLSAVQRDQSGTPVKLHTPTLLGSRSGVATSLAWGKSNQVVALYRSATGNTSTPVSFLVGGDSSELLPVADAKLVLASSSGAVFVLTSDNKLLENRGYSWNLVATDVDAAHFKP